MAMIGSSIAPVFALSLVAAPAMYRVIGMSGIFIFIAVLAAVAILGWFLPIPFLEPRIDFPLPPAEETSGLRLSTYLQAQQVEAFRLSSGRLPDVLREAGKTIPGMIYERIDASTYRLVGATERATVRWISTDSLSALLGDAPKRFPAVAR